MDDDIFSLSTLTASGDKLFKLQFQSKNFYHQRAISSYTETNFYNRALFVLLNGQTLLLSSPHIAASAAVISS
jgi:hypothetical protein